MAERTLKYVLCHEDNAITLKGLAIMVTTMRWDDLECVAFALDDIRRKGQRESRRRLSACDVHAWAQELVEPSRVPKK